MAKTLSPCSALWLAYACACVCVCVYALRVGTFVLFQNHHRHCPWSRVMCGYHDRGCRVKGSKSLMHQHMETACQFRDSQKASQLPRGQSASDLKVCMCMHSGVCMFMCMYFWQKTTVLESPILCRATW